jgi:hypothetical protein
MEEHRIGVPTLIAHIAKAIKREQRYIPQKTLQRFLAGEMRTNDASVSIFHEFVRALPPARDELAELALVLCAFFKPPADRGEPLEPAPIPGGIFQACMGSPPAHEKHVLTRLAVGFMTVAPRASFVRVTERRFAPPLPPEARPGLDRDTERGESFEGVLAHFDGAQVGVLRSTVTRHPRIHWFTQEDSRLWSVCQVAPVRDEGGQLLGSEHLHFEHLGDIAP